MLRKKLSNATIHIAQLRTANKKSCYTSHAGKTSLPILAKPIHLPALAVPRFSEDLIPVAILTSKGNKVVFTKENCLLLGPSALLYKGIINKTKYQDKLYIIDTKLAKPNKQQAMKR